MPPTASLLPEDPELLAGYRLLGRLGTGGQGVVYLAEPAGGGRVAVKVLHRASADGTGPFLAETELVRRVRPFCTAQVIDSGLAGGRPYIVSEYVEGPNLAQVIEGRGALRGPELGRLALGTMTALAAVHQAGVVHRDFKPANVLLGRDGPRVIDFGIAQVLDVTAGTADLVGTPPYMAPEQFSGEHAGPPADMFAWASTIVCAATGRPPFGTEPMPVVINRILNGEPDLGGAVELDGELRELVAACLDKDPARRPTAPQALMRLLGGEVPAREILPEGSRRAAPPPAGRPRRVVTAVSAAGVLAVAGLLAGGLLAPRLLSSGDPAPSPSLSGSAPVPAVQPTMAAASTTETALPGSDLTLRENPADEVWVSAFQDWRKHGAPGFLRDPRSGAFTADGNLKTTVVSPGGRFVASLAASRLYAPDYDRIRITDRASGAAYDIRTVDRPLITDNPSWSGGGAAGILLTVYEDLEDDRPSVGFAVVDPAARTARITRMPATGHHPYVWGPEPGTVMHRGPGGAVLVYGLDGSLRRTIPGVGDLSGGGGRHHARGRPVPDRLPGRARGHVRLGLPIGYAQGPAADR
ncbi:serine/threonine-protein kinase [Planomonospora venezuelensis]|uniref:serine/threonine-protein kinase n=1 Tax=Planomonospora venezuelensis TaxID=1999 RepID=UPI0031E673D7